MRPLFMAVLCMLFALPARALQAVSAAELEDYLAPAQHRSDAEVASRLSSIESAERLSWSQLGLLQAKCPGEECRRALMALADPSLFVEPPPSPSEDVPSLAEQKEIAARLVDFVQRMDHQMPNFLATRTTERFEDWPKGVQIGSVIAGRKIPLQFAGQSYTTVLYRDGREIASNEKAVAKAPRKEYERGLLARGLFGPMLTTVVVDASKSEFVWSHWEGDGPERLAVFRFAVPMDKSTYEVKYCCVPLPHGLSGPLDRMTAYHGEISVHPEDGSIANITLIADLEKGELSVLLEEAAEGEPLLAANLAVAYGQVEIGGKPYTCPVKAVAFSRARTMTTEGRLGTARTYLDDVTFTSYRVFRSEARILSGRSEK